MGKVKCFVACFDSDGVATLFPVVVEVSEEGYQEGEHVEAACWAAEYHGMDVPEAPVVFDERTGRPSMFMTQDWSEAAFAPAYQPV